MLQAVDVAENTVETANGGVIEAFHRADVLVRDLENLTTALDGGWWTGWRDGVLSG